MLLNSGHGSYQICVKERVIISQSFGSWNDVTINNFIKEYQGVAQNLINKPWAGIVDVTHWELATLEAENIAKGFELWCKEHNRQYVAIVGITPLVNYQLARAGLTRPHQQENIKFFTYTDDAVGWLTGLNFFNTTRGC